MISTTHKPSQAGLMNAILLLLLLLLSALPVARFIILPLLLSLFLTMLSTPVINHLESVGFGRLAIIALFTILVIGLAFLTVTTILPLLHREAMQISGRISAPEIYTSLQNVLTLPRSNRILENYCDFVIYMKHQSVNTLRDNPPLFMVILIVPVLFFLILKDGYYLKKSFIQSLPNHYIEMMVNLLHRIEERMNIWLKAQLLVGLIAGGLTTLALISLHIDNFLLIGFMVGFSFLTPYFGPLIGTLIAITFALLETGSIRFAVAIIIAFATIKLLHNLLFETYIRKRALNLHPLVVLLLLFAGAYMAGFIGLLTIVPAANLFLIFMGEIYSNFKSYGYI